MSDSSPYAVAALYKFVTLDDPESLRASIRREGDLNELVGTILLAHEGINGTIAGSPSGVERFLAFLRTHPALADLEPKMSSAYKMPFYRLKVKVKPEIVTLGVPEVDAANNAGTYVDPQDWNDLISDPDVVVIDTRNDYEVGIGTFKNAVDPDLKTFGELPEWVDNADALKPGTKVAMFCTGGIRCEKSTALLKQRGFDDVYHLKGGILKYLELVPEADSLWQGECFVFDERVSVVHGLETGTHDLCRACRRPINASDKASAEYQPGVSCPACVNEHTEERKARLAERQKQVELANARQERHMGAVFDSSARCKPEEPDMTTEDVPPPVAAPMPTLDVSQGEHPLLYSFRRCPYAMRARMALQASGKVCELREVVLRDKPSHFIEISPKATVPVVLYDNDKVLEESIDVMLWALDDNDPQNWLTPDAGSYDGMLKLIERCDGDFKHHLDRFKYPNRYEDEGAVSEEHRDQGAVFLRELDERLSRSPFLFGARPSLADVAIAPFVRQFANHDRKWFDAEPWPHLHAWLETFMTSGLFQNVMKKYPQWKPGDPVTLFPEQRDTSWQAPQATV